MQGASLRACWLSRDISGSSRFTFIGKDLQQPPPRVHSADPNSAKGCTGNDISGSWRAALAGNT